MFPPKSIKGKSVRVAQSCSVLRANVVGVLDSYLVTYHICKRGKVQAPRFLGRKACILSYSEYRVFYLRVGDVETVLLTAPLESGGGDVPEPMRIHQIKQLTRGPQLPLLQIVVLPHQF